LWEGRGTMKKTFVRIYRDITGKEKPSDIRGQVVEEASEGTNTPPEEKATDKEAKAMEN
jgi:hypothetical protein